VKCAAVEKSEKRENQSNSLNNEFLAPVTPTQSVVELKWPDEK
jgi:hypothetical protein